MEFHDPKSSQDDGSKPSSDDEKKVNEDPRKDSESIDQEKDDNVNSTNNVNAAIINEVHVVGGKTSIELPDDPNMPALEDISIFDLSRDNKDVVIGDMQSATQTRNMSKNLEEHGKNPKRYTQEEGIDYDEVFAPVARIETIRLFLAYASLKDFVVYQMDIKSAFLYRKIEAEVYVCQPPGFEDPYFPDRVYKVEKALHGLHQAPRAWYETFLTYLLDNESQDCKHTNGNSKPLLKDEDDEEVNVHMYRSMIGSLIYLTSLRPDIMFAVCVCARYQVNPKVSHLHAVKMIFSNHYIEPTELEIQEMVKILVSGEEYDKVFNHLDMLNAPFEGKCKKQTVVANSITEAEYVAASSCCGQVLWIQN
ncbi:retrovirus-related pol polyprotein from transposon TNT 1-94 [Tanacetum coccineum]